MSNVQVFFDPCWAPAEQYMPDLLDDVMYMDTVLHAGRRIEQYKHIDTRRYVNLDRTGWAWDISVDAETGEVTVEQIDTAAAIAHLIGAQEVRN